MNTVVRFLQAEALAYGLHEACFINRLRYWVTLNREGRRNYRDGRTWSYDSADAIGKELGLSERQIRHVVKKLVQRGVIVIGKYNKHDISDRANWYAFQDEKAAVDEVTGQIRRGAKFVGWDGAEPSAPDIGVGLTRHICQIDPTNLSDHYRERTLQVTNLQQATAVAAAPTHSASDNCEGKKSAQDRGSEAAPISKAPPEPTSMPERIADVIPLFPRSLAGEDAANVAPVVAAASGGGGGDSRQAAILGAFGGGSGRSGDEDRPRREKGPRGGRQSGGDGNGDGKAKSAPRKRPFEPMTPSPLFEHWLRANDQAGYCVPRQMNRSDGDVLERLVANCGDQEKAATYLMTVVGRWDEIKRVTRLKAEFPTLHILTGTWMASLMPLAMRLAKEPPRTGSAPAAGGRTEVRTEDGGLVVKRAVGRPMVFSKRLMKDGDETANARSQEPKKD